MRAGQLDKVIVIERASETIDSAGVPTWAWASHLTMRAKVIDTNSDEIMRNPGDVSENLTVFRTRFIDDITLADRIAYAGRHYDIKGVKEIGRRVAVEIRALAKGAA